MNESTRKMLSEKPIKRQGLLSQELYDKIINILNKDIINMSLQEKSKWLHLMDGVECGTITPMEAYDTIKIGYVAEHLLVRNSNYSHVL